MMSSIGLDMAASSAFGNSAQLHVAHIMSKAARLQHDLHARDHADYLS